MNIFFVRAVSAALDTLTKPGHAAKHACGIDTVYPFVNAAPTFQKHHDISPRVPITGVAGVTNQRHLQSSGGDVVRVQRSTGDRVHVRRLRGLVTRPAHCYYGFTLTYPATWFLLPQQSNTPGEMLLIAQVGGNTNAVTMSMSFLSGSPADLAGERRSR